MPSRLPSSSSPSPSRREESRLAALIRHHRTLGLGDYLRRTARASVAAAMLAGCGASHGLPGDGGVPDGDPTDAFFPDTSRPDARMPDGGTPDAGPPDAMPPEPSNVCDDDGVYRMVHGLSLPEAPTYLAAVGGAEWGGLPSIQDAIGVQCGGAADPATCGAEVSRVVGETWQRALLVTEGDAVTTTVAAEDVRSFLGEVDTPKEAALLAWHAGYDIYCAGDFTTVVTEVPSGYRLTAYRASGGCGSPWVTTRYTLHVDPMGYITEEDAVVVAEEEDFGCIGRRPVGLEACGDAPAGADPVGDWFANVARLEESAVAAFDRMLLELDALGAPAHLLARAREAREDEVRHTASMGALARRFGCEPLRPRVADAPLRSAFDIALENAVEGCVRETFGALVGAHQALRARDPEIAEAMQTVADDEIRHAELSWALAAWLEPRLTEEERAAIEAARRDAVVMLRHQAASPVDAEVALALGLPEPAVAVGMVDQLARDVWA